MRIKTYYKNLVKYINLIRNVDLFDWRSEEQKQLQKRISDHLENIPIFEGSKKDFENHIGYETEVVNLELGEARPELCAIIYEGKKTLGNQYRLYSTKDRKKIFNSGVIALVDSHFYDTIEVKLIGMGSTFTRTYAERTRYAGTPVKRK